MQWFLRDPSCTKRVLLFVSKFGHCLGERSTAAASESSQGMLLWYPTSRARFRWAAVGRHFLLSFASPKDTKSEQEAQLKVIDQGTDADRVISCRTCR